MDRKIKQKLDLIGKTTFGTLKGLLSGLKKIDSQKELDS